MKPEEAEALGCQSQIRQETKRQSSGSKTRLRTWLELLKVARMVEAELRERLRVTFGTTLPRFDVLAALYRSEDGMRMGDLSEALMVSNGNVTGLVERLVNDGMVVRVPVDGDRRALFVRLTKKGSERFAEMARVHEAWVDEILSELSASEGQQIISLLRRVRQRKE